MKSILRIVSSVGVNCKAIKRFNGDDRFPNFSMIIFTNLFHILNLTKLHQNKGGPIHGAPIS
jgi:hypothetical protein